MCEIQEATCVPLLVAVTFLTVLPLGLSRAPAPRELGASIVWYPAVGYAIGGLLALLDIGVRHTALAPLPAAALLTATLAVLTGFLHLDGLIDTCDAAFAHRTRTERLAIARDPRAGAFGVVGVVLALLLKAALLAGPLAGHRTAVFISFPALARATMTTAVVIAPAARGTAGLGGGVKEFARPWMAVAAVVIALVPTALLLRWDAIALLLGAAIGGGGIGLFAVRRLGGTTGDVFGAICECAEIGALLGAALVS
jgi:adenosylcobinamide-GDP ribazoletransferase